MENILGIALLGFFVYTGYHTETYNAQTYAQMAISLLGGSYFLISNNVDKIKSLFTKTKSNVTPAAPISVEDNSFKDFECISYLRDRCQEIGSQESVEMAIQINTALFKSRIK